MTPAQGQRSGAGPPRRQRGSGCGQQGCAGAGVGDAGVTVRDIKNKGPVADPVQRPIFNPDIYRRVFLDPGPSGLLD